MEEIHSKKPYCHNKKAKISGYLPIFCLFVFLSVLFKSVIMYLGIILVSLGFNLINPTRKSTSHGQKPSCLLDMVTWILDGHPYRCFPLSTLFNFLDPTGTGTFKAIKRLAKNEKNRNVSVTIPTWYWIKGFVFTLHVKKVQTRNQKRWHDFVISWIVWTSLLGNTNSVKPKVLGKPKKKLSLDTLYFLHQWRDEKKVKVGHRLESKVKLEIKKATINVIVQEATYSSRREI